MNDGDFSSETIDARRKWHNFSSAKERNFQTRNLHSAKISFRNEDIKILLNERKLRNILVNKYTVKGGLDD